MKRFVMAICSDVRSFRLSVGGPDTNCWYASAPTSRDTTNTTSPGDIPTSGSAEQISDAALSALLTVFGLLAV